MRRVALLLFAAVLAACSADDGADEEGRTLSTSEVRASTTEPSTASTAPPVDCGGPVGGLPEDAAEVSEGLGDFDGNGSTDQLIAFVDDREWHLLVVFDGGGEAELELESVARGDRVRAVGGVDLDGAAGDEGLAVIGAGASATLIGVFRVVDCELVQARAESGDPAALFVGGSAVEGVGVSCADGGVVQLKAESSDGRRYATTRTTLRLDGETLRVVEVEPGPRLVRGVDDEELARYYGFECGTLGLGPDVVRSGRAR